MIKTTLLVGGLQGTGKSVLWKLCQMHPQIDLTEEFYNFLKLDVSYTEHIRIVRDRLKKDRCNVLIDKEKFFIKHQGLANRMFLARYWMGLQRFRDKRITPEVIRSVLHRIFPQAVVVGDVGPNYYVRRLVNIRTALPVVMYRDCRDVAASIAWKFRKMLSQPNVPEWLQKRDSAEKVARLWTRRMEKMEQYTEKIYFMRYEDMVTNPQKTLAALAERLGVDPHQFPYHKIHTNGVGMYKQHLSSKDVADIVAVAGPTMERLGYL